MNTYKRILSVLAVLALVSSSALVALAQGPGPDPNQYPNQVTVDPAQAQGMPPGPSDQPPPTGDPQNDPPGRAARLQFMTGSVSVQPHGTDGWVAGVINRPLTNSDNVWADKNSRAEINVGSGLIRIDSESSLTLTNVSENAVQLQLHQGAMILHVRSLTGESYEVDTQNQAFTVLKPGDYRFDVNPDADTTVITVWGGEGESSGQGPAVRIHENEQARFSNGTSMKNEMHAAPELDAFDQWASSRDERSDQAATASASYVSPDVVGSDDLAEYGSWRNTPDYGNVWVPTSVAVGWAPYRNGNWIWVAPWGWTWVAAEPWGYAPFHYGRWVYYNNYWGWAPGPIYARPYYSPALVAFYGGAGWGVSVGFGFGGGYGWCPLGFGEPYVPWYRVSHGYFNRVNITNTRITNINNVYNNTYINRGGLHGSEPLHYANMRAPNGFTAVSRDTMVNSRQVARNNVRVSPNEMSRMSPVRSLDVQPTRTTMLGANAGRSAAIPPARTFARPVYSNGVSLHSGSDAMPNHGGGGGFNGAPNGTGPNSNVRMPGQGAPAPHSVPRPPYAGGMDRGNVGSGYNQGGSNPRSNVYRQPGTSTWQQNNSRPESSTPPSSGYPSGRQPAYEGYSRPSPSSGGGSYSRPAPSYDHSAPVNGGGRASGAPASGGGSRPSGNSGGGRASAPSHSSGGGGGGGGSHNSGGGGGSHGRH
jgi:FecR protein